LLDQPDPSEALGRACTGRNEAELGLPGLIIDVYGDTVVVQANRGWQPAGLIVDSNSTYRIRTRGEVSLGQPADRWTSTARGISIHYTAGRPIGTLLVAVLPELTPPVESLAGTSERSLTNPGEIPAFSPAETVEKDLLSPSQGETVWSPPQTGTMWFRVNDGWNSLSDNSGSFDVLIEPASNE